MKLHAEAQRRFDYAAGRTRLVAGGAYRYERADTRDDAGASTILRGIRTARIGALYGQIDQELAKDHPVDFRTPIAIDISRGHASRRTRRA